MSKSNLVLGLSLILTAIALNRVDSRQDISPEPAYRPVLTPAPAYQPVATQQTSFSAATLQHAQTTEAKELIQQFDPNGLLELQPLAVKLVAKLQSEGKDVEWSKAGAAALIAFVPEECQPLTPKGRKDFSQSLVNASLDWQHGHQ